MIRRPFNNEVEMKYAVLICLVVLFLTSCASPRIGGMSTSPKDGLLMVYVPAGDFRMASDARPPDQKPAHSVYLDSFWIDRTDVTKAMYAKCVSADACSQPNTLSFAAHSNYCGNSHFDNYPVI
jgi:formylglycine-generating enzyme required for sulfatase activity